MTEDTPGQDPQRNTDVRLSSLDQRLKEAQAEEALRTAKAPAQDANYRQGSRVLSYLIGGPLGGALIGWLLDRWLGTSPWILLIMLFLGMAAGFRSIIRISNERPD